MNPRPSMGGEIQSDGLGRVAEVADALASGASDPLKVVEVRVLSRPPSSNLLNLPTLSWAGRFDLVYWNKWLLQLEF